MPIRVDPEVVEALALARPDGREPRPLLESHGAYVFGVLVAARPFRTRIASSYLEVDLVATPGVVVTVRKSPSGGGEPFDVSALHPAADQKAAAGELVHRLVDEVAESFLESLDAAYAEIEELEDGLDTWQPSRIRTRLADLRHELLHGRRTVAATRAAVRRVLDGRIEVGDHALFPPDVERLFAGDVRDARPGRPRSSTSRATSSPACATTTSRRSSRVRAR